VKKFNSVAELQHFICSSFCNPEANEHSTVGHHKWKDHASFRLKLKIWVDGWFWGIVYFIKGEN